MGTTCSRSSPCACSTSVIDTSTTTAYMRDSLVIVVGAILAHAPRTTQGRADAWHDRSPRKPAIYVGLGPPALVHHEEARGSRRCLCFPLSDLYTERTAGFRLRSAASVRPCPAGDTSMS